MNNRGEAVLYRSGAFNEFYIPERMMGGIQRYVDYGVQPGSFLTAVICNDFVGACQHADDENIRNLPAYAAYFYNEVPHNARGSAERMAEWTEAREAERQRE